METRHQELITEIILTAFRIKLNMLENRLPIYILTERDYENLQFIKALISEIEELDTLPIKQSVSI